MVSETTWTQRGSTIEEVWEQLFLTHRTPCQMSCPPDRLFHLLEAALFRGVSRSLFREVVSPGTCQLQSDSGFPWPDL